MSDFFSDATTGFLKPISELLNDESVSEIMVNGYNVIYAERKGKIFKTKASFEDEDQLMSAVRRIAQAVGKTIDSNNQIMDGRLPDGSRVHAVMPPAARKGIYLSIRKFTRDSLSIKQLVQGGAMTVDMAKFINLCCILSKNIIISGGTSSGKTTLLNVVSSLIPKDQRIVVIEDASELSLQQEHVLPMETRAPDPQGEGGVSMRDLVKASLRMRPDRIIIGEVRGPEAMDLLQAMNTGHSGSMATIHANNPKGALSRLETLALMSDVELPLRALRSQISSAIDIVIQASRLRDGSRRITYISEIMELDDQGNYQVNDLFTFQVNDMDSEGKMLGVYEPTGILPSFLEDAKAQGFAVDESLFEK